MLYPVNKGFIFWAKKKTSVFACIDGGNLGGEHGLLLPISTSCSNLLLIKAQRDQRKTKEKLFQEE